MATYVPVLFEAKKHKCMYYNTNYVAVHLDVKHVC